MKKEEVRNLQDQFTNLFRPQTHQQSQNQNSDTNLLDSYEPSRQLNSVAFKQISQTQSESQQEDFLDQVDDILGHGQQNEEQLTRREIMLNFKINELKLMCKNLKMANTKLAERIEELERPRSEIVENTVQLSTSHNLTMMQQQFSEIQEELAKYKQQLAKYQQQMASTITIKNQEISRFKKDMNELMREKERLDRDLKEKDTVIQLLEQRNEELLLAIEQLQTNLENQNMSTKGSRGHGRDSTSHFNQKISMEMESMIDKLLNQLKYEKRTSSKHLSQIKRLNTQIITLENRLKQRNNKVYELQLTIIKMNKQSSTPLKSKTAKRQYESKDESLAGYLPHRNYVSYLEANKSKNQLNSKTYNKNRISAQRQEGNTSQAGNYGNLLPLSKVFNTFTLMDLLNRQFKIRTAEMYVIACRVIELYATKLQRGDYSNLISEELQVYNFNSQAPGQLKVRINSINRNESYQTNQQSMLYNMAFILDTLINQVEVLDPNLESLELNIPSYIEEILNKQTRQEKCKILYELSHNIEKEYLH